MYRNILIVKLSAIGDVIHALPVAHAIKAAYPAARVTWIVEPPAYDIVCNHPDIDEVILFEKKKFKAFSGFICNFWPFVSSLRAHRFDVALDLQGLGKSAAIAFLSGAPRRLGYCNMREHSDIVSKPVIGANHAGHIVERYLDVARALGCEVQQVMFNIGIPAAAKQRAAATAKAAGLDIDCPYIVLAPGANWPNKRWPTEHFAVLADMIFDDERIPVLVGAEADDYFAQEINRAARIPPVNLTGRTTLPELAWLIGRARAFVGGDTGTMHLAVAVGTPVVALLGPTDENRNGPYQGNNRTLVADRECKGCWRRACPRHEDCLSAIAPAAVYQKLGEVL